MMKKSIGCRKASDFYTNCNKNKFTDEKKSF